MIGRLILLILLGTGIAFADTPKAGPACKEFVEPLVRLKCYDEAVSKKKITFHDIAFEILESPPAIAAIAAALLALISGISGPLVQLKIGKRQAAAAQASANASTIAANASSLAARASMLTAQNAGNREIARMRLAWMDKLRDVLSEYHSILMSTDDATIPEAEQKLSQLGTQIDLLLNQDDKIQKALWDVADKIFNLKTKEARQALDDPLIKAGRAVFKAEWEKIKAEMRGEPFQTGE